MYLEIIDLHSTTNSPEKLEKLFTSWQETFKSEHDKLNIVFHPQKFWDSRFKINLIDETNIAASLSLHPHNYNNKFSETKLHLQDKTLNEFLKKQLSQSFIFEQLFIPEAYRKNFKHKLVDTIIGCGYEFMMANNYDSMTAIARADKNIDQIASQFGAKNVHSVELNNTPCCFIYTLKNEVVQHPIPEIRDIISQLWNTYENKQRSNNKMAS